METTGIPQDELKPQEKPPATKPQAQVQARPEAILWNTPQVAAYLNVKESTIRYWVHTGYIPHIKFQALVRYRQQDIDEWLNQRAAAGPKKAAKKIAEDAVGNIVESIQRPPRRGRQPRARRDPA